MRYTKFFASLLLLLSLCAFAAEAHNSKAWQARIDARTATLWVEGQPLGDGIILNARAELSATWLERGLVHELDRDRDVDEWVVTNLSWYSSSRKENQAKIKGRDVLVLNFRAVKYWTFDPARLTVDGKAVTPDDILTKAEYRNMEDLSPGMMGSVAVAISPLKPGRTVEFRYDDALATLKVPGR